MAKQPKKSTPKTAAPNPRWPLAAVVGAAMLGGVWWIWQNQASNQFERLVQDGKAALEGQQIKQTDHGRGHSNLNVAISYPEDPPTSGVHWPNWTEPGIYNEPQPKEKLVHALEHGNIVVYYDQPTPEVVATLKGWANNFRGQWDGMVLVPRSGLGSTVELTAWAKLLRLQTWDPAVAAAFIDAYRGRGPENPVR